MSFAPRVIADLVDPATCALLAAYARDRLAAGALHPDRLVPGSPAGYGDPLMDTLLRQLHERVEELIGAKLLPTYTYYRLYHHGDALPPHTDRESCEVSLSLCLASDGPDWPLVVQSEDGARAMSTPVGAAVLYPGPVVEHWREPYAGREQVQLFLHYVRADGPYREYARDRREQFGTSPRQADQPRDLADHILVLDDLLPAEVRHALLAEYRDCDLWVPATISADDRRDNSVRACDVIDISAPATIGDSEHRRALDHAVFQAVGNAGRAYVQHSPRVRLRSDTGYQLIRYQPGGFYAQHVDHFEESPRTLSLSICLNDDFSGGHLSFFHGEHSIAPKAGRGMIFPANFLYPHQVTRVTEGTRYVIVTWFR